MINTAFAAQAEVSLEAEGGTYSLLFSGPEAPLAALEIHPAVVATWLYLLCG